MNREGRYSGVMRTVLSECKVRRRKMNVQLIANEENQDRPQRGKNQACGMVLIV